MSVEVYIVSRHEENQEENNDMSLEKFVWLMKKQKFSHSVSNRTTLSPDSVRPVISLTQISMAL